MTSQNVFWLPIGTGPEWPARMCSSWQLGPGPNGQPECVPAANRDQARMPSQNLFQMAIGTGPE